MDDLFLNPARIGGIIADIGARMKRRQPLVMEDDGVKASVWDGNYGFDADDYDVQNGIAVVPVRGGLISAQIPGWSSYADCTYESLIAAGSIRVPVGAPWAQDFLEELTMFPYATSDDQVDALTQYLAWIAEHPSPRPRPRPRRRHNDPRANGATHPAYAFRRLQSGW